MRKWSEMMIEMGYKHAKLCNEDSVTYINCLIEGAGMRLVMVTVYNSLVSTKRIKKIQDLPIEEKNTLWVQTKEFTDNKLNLQETINLSKALYAIEYLLNNPACA